MQITSTYDTRFRFLVMMYIIVPHHQLFGMKSILNFPLRALIHEMDGAHTRLSDTGFFVA